MTAYNRAAEDVGNLIALEHVNLQVPDQSLATAFYVSGLGLTRDPFMFPGTQFMWVNAGRNQFHLLGGPPQRVSGTIGLVVPSLDRLLKRLAAVQEELEGTQFSFKRNGERLEVTCPWGNRFRVHATGELSPRMALGLPYIEFDVAPGVADAIVRFYREVLLAHAVVGEIDGARVARVAVGIDQELRFRETSEPILAFDGHHVQVYVANFSVPHRRLVDLALLTEESNAYQYRFDTVVELRTGETVARIEHEVRSLTHPLYGRPLVNRNPDQDAMQYAQGLDAFVPPDSSRSTDDPRLKAILAEREADLARTRES